MRADAGIAESQRVDDREQLVRLRRSLAEQWCSTIQGRDAEPADGVALASRRPHDDIHGVNRRVEWSGRVGSRHAVTQWSPVGRERIAHAAEEEVEQRAWVGGPRFWLQETRVFKSTQRGVHLARRSREFVAKHGERCGRSEQAEGNDQIEGTGLRGLAHIAFYFSEQRKSMQ